MPPNPIRLTASAAALVVAAFAACGGGGPSGDSSRAGGDGPADGPTRVALDAGAIAADGELALELPPDAVSALVTFVLEGAEDTIGIIRVTAPDGTVLHATTFEADSWEAVTFSSAIAVEPLVGTGDLALLLPVSPRTPLVPGTYRVAIETDPPDAAFSRVTATVRRDAAGAVAARRPHVVDLHVHVLSPESARYGANVGAALDTLWRDALDRMLVPHALAVGTTTASVASRDERSRLGRLDGEREMSEACRATRQAARASDDRGVPILHVGLVAEIDDSLVGGGADGETELESERGDLLTGLSPLPGLPYEDDSSNACIFIAEGAWSGLDAQTAVELLAANLLHELGHFAGLSHPSEDDGETFDLLDDTPRCTRPDAESCGPAGGADNVMFHSGDESSLPWTLSADQAWVLRRHPLFRPARRDRH